MGEYLHIAYLPVVSFGCESDTSDEYCNQMAEEDKLFKIENDIHILRSDGESQTLNLTESNYSADVLFNFRNYESYLYLLYTSGNEDIIKEYNLEELFN
jgi:hypothetical protein